MSSPSRSRKSKDVEGLQASIFNAIKNAEIAHQEKKERASGVVRRRSRSRSGEIDVNDDKLRRRSSNLFQEGYEAVQSKLKLATVSFVFACANGDLETAKHLLRQKPALIHYAPVLDHGYAGLHYAAKGGHIDVVRYLLRKGANVNLQTVGGYTALHLAAICNKRKMVEVLLKEYCADTSLQDMAGHTYDSYVSWPIRVEKSRFSSREVSPTGSQFSRMGSIRKALTGFFSDALSTRGGVA